MSKHQEILDYLEKLPIGKRVSVRSISNFLNVSDGTAYRAIKEAENQGIVETRPRSGTIRVKSQKVVLEHLTYREIQEITGSEILAGDQGLEKEFNKFYIGAMTEEHVLDYVSEGGLLIVGDRTNIQRLALKHDNAVLVTGGCDSLSQPGSDPCHSDKPRYLYCRYHDQQSLVQYADQDGYLDGRAGVSSDA